MFEVINWRHIIPFRLYREQLGYQNAIESISECSNRKLAERLFRARCD